MEGLQPPGSNSQVNPMSLLTSKNDKKPDSDMDMTKGNKEASLMQIVVVYLGIFLPICAFLSVYSTMVRMCGLTSSA